MNTVASKIIEGLTADKRVFSTTETQVISDRVTLSVSPSLQTDSPTHLELRFRSPKGVSDISQGMFPMLLFKFAFDGKGDWGGLMQRALEGAVRRGSFAETQDGWSVSASLNGADTVLQLSRAL